ncbi:MAG TPA: hypothetical protein VIQ30_16630 [Pseudonocardia sp.]
MPSRTRTGLQLPGKLGHHATIRTHLINVPARLARTARRLTPAPTPAVALGTGLGLHAAIHQPRTG